MIGIGIDKGSMKGGPDACTLSQDESLLCKLIMDTSDFRG